MEDRVIQLYIEPPIARIVLNRPEKLNAINLPWINQFNEALDEVSCNPNIRLVLIRGTGKAFCSGLDLDMMASEGMPKGFFEGQERAFRLLETMDKLVVAAIHGYCLGGGVQLAIACDFRICSSDAILALPAVYEGLFPGMAPFRLPRLIGLAFARRLILCGETITPEEALRIGLVDWVIPAENFEEGVNSIVQKLLSLPTRATIHAKALMLKAFERSFEDVFEDSLYRLKDCLQSPEVTMAKERWLSRKKGRKDKKSISPGEVESNVTSC